VLLLASVLCPGLQANDLPVCPLQPDVSVAQAVPKTTSHCEDGCSTCVRSAAKSSPAGNLSGERFERLMVIGFMGGRVRADNLVHEEARMAKDLQARYPLAVDALVFANHDSDAALSTVLKTLDENKDGHLSALEKERARIVIYGHSWGASETVTLARRLNQLGIPVMLTVQVDSVQKVNENDFLIPPNVREAVNFYQSDGILHGRSSIQAMNPERTSILGNYESTYRRKPVSCAGYPWLARTFMKAHIEIENDPAVWSRIEALIQKQILLKPGGNFGSEPKIAEKNPIPAPPGRQR
jgi:hypothetical protein